MTVALYCRISADKSGKREGVKAQETWGRAYAAKHWPGEPVQVFSDNNISAAGDDHRPRYEALRAAVQAGQITYIWTVEQARLERRKAEWFELAAELIVAGIDEVHTRRDGLIILDDLGSDVRAIVNARYVAEIKRKTRDKHEVIAAAGRPSGGTVFGYRPGVDDQGRKSILVEPAEAEALRWAADAVLSGQSLTSIARELTRRGFVGRRGKQIRLPVQVKAMLTNPTVAGLRTHHGNLSQGVWEPILPEQTWRQVRSRLTAPRKVTNPAGDCRVISQAKFTNRAVRRYLLTGGLARCGVCGAAMIGCMQHRPATSRRPKHSLPYLVCPPKNRANSEGRGCVGIMMEPTEELVVGMLLTELDTPAFRAALAAEADEHAGRRAALDRDLEEIAEQRTELAAMWARKELGTADWGAARGALDDREALLFTEKNALPPAPAKGEFDEDLASKWFDGMTLHQQREELRRRVREVVVGRGKPGATAFDDSRVSVRPVVDLPLFGAEFDYQSSVFTTGDDVLGAEAS
jgi:DNA invertase Pin-like site-specific DNA recombinase